MYFTANKSNKRCEGPVKCGSNNFCVGWAWNKPYCYGSDTDCLWDKNDCTKDEDCKKYPVYSSKFTTAVTDMSCSDDPGDWMKDACTCEDDGKGWLIFSIQAFFRLKWSLTTSNFLSLTPPDKKV